MNFLTEFIGLINIFFFAILLIVFSILIFFHIFSEIKNKRNLKLSQKLITLLDNEKKRESAIQKKKALFSANGLRILLSVSYKLNSEQKEALRKILSGKKFSDYFRNNLTFKKQPLALLTTRIIAEYKLDFFTPEILLNLKRWESDSEAQQVGLLALFANGRNKELLQLFANEDFKFHISFRTTQELIENLQGDKVEFFKALLSKKCDIYIYRACIQSIGKENLKELSEYVTSFLSSKNLNLLISTTRALGDLNYKPAKEKLEELLKESEWELTCVIVEALAKIDPKGCYETILPFVFHKEWWVRYRTAESLVSISDKEKLLSDIKKHNDKYADEIISYMIQKKELTEEGVENV